MCSMLVVSANETTSNLMNEFPFQKLTSAQKENTTAVLMPCATIPRNRTTVHVNLDILEMERHAQVIFCAISIKLLSKRNQVVCLLLLQLRMRW